MDGSVGIGTSTPATTLDVRSATPVITVGTAANTGGALYFGNPGHGVKRAFNGANDVGLYTTAADLYLSANGTTNNQFVLKNNGNVGLGTAGPVTTLDVRSATPVVTVGTAANTGGALYFGNPAHGVKRAYNGGDDVGLYTTAADLYLSANGTTNNHFVLKNNGRVGIGTAGPVTTLDVRSATPVITVGTAADTGGALYFGNPGHGVKRAFNGGNDVGLYTTAADLYLSANGTTNNQFVLKNNGDVGIGTASPTAKLHVAGTVAASGLRAPGAGINTGTFAFTHRATAGSVIGVQTIIVNPHCDGDPDAILIVTHNHGKDTSANPLHPQSVGVSYTGANWIIFHEDGATPMQVGDAFNVMVIKP